MKDIILAIVPFLPACSLYSRFHLLCPACGNTRSVTALLHGDIAEALHYNPVPALLALLILLAYIEFAAHSFGRNLRILPRSLSFYLVLIALLVVYFIARNLYPPLAP
ncbi:DUF2752 domain-containing protein [Anaerotaenia torta]|uniref:DUF2752 domain-containing protein n=1 Tax=Anaerotaenia torta TaxID=433293 RepID=UPI003D213B27